MILEVYAELSLEYRQVHGQEGSKGERKPNTSYQ